MATSYEDAQREVLAAIGAWALREMQGQPERSRALFDALVPLFDGRYPHHKILTHFCVEAREPKDVTAAVDLLPGSQPGS